MQQDERSYLIRRAAQSRDLARAAADTTVRHIHLIMAERYAGRLAALERESASVALPISGNPVTRPVPSH